MRTRWCWARRSLARGPTSRSGAVVVHAVVGPDCTVPGGIVVRNRVWFEHAGDAAGAEYPAAVVPRPPRAS